ncbi:hypothetical protein M3223_02825 [Paenibacillus pasadenensis]|uniref:hypothetical protein n=1 Tax=Paenibacillus pasadenensis TaxID=217090 RepID=UPI002040360F|nr:hypothetical protein [Paenibacillus pasadenensis]MCM3746280.1 hypothetical protein [Paenibacillus pasadenensis]
MKPELVLILFILLIIVARLFYKPVKKNSHAGSNYSRLNSVGFNIYNETRNFTLAATSLTGDFESPFPREEQHIISPGGETGFQVETSTCPNLYSCVGKAIATFSILNSQNVSEGTVIITMEYTETIWYSVDAKMTADVSGPVAAVTSKRYVEIRNL